MTPDSQIEWLDLAQYNLVAGDSEAADSTLAAAEARAQSSREYDSIRLLRGWVAIARGAPDTANQLLRGMSKAVGDPFGEGVLRLNAESCAAWEDAIRRRDASYDDSLFALVYLVLGRYCAAVGKYALAFRAFDRGLFFDEAGASGLHTTFRLALGAALLEAGYVDAAYRELEAVGAAGEEALGINWPQWNELLAVWFSLTGHYGAAIRHLEASAAWLQRRGVEVPHCRALLNLAYVSTLCGQLAAARVSIAAVRDKARGLGNQELLSACADLDRVQRQAAEDMAIGMLPIASSWEFVRRPSEPDRPPPPDIPSASFLARFHASVTILRRGLGVQPRSRSIRDQEKIELRFGESDSHLIQVENRLSRAMLRQIERDFFGALQEYRAAAQRLIVLGLRPRLCVVLRLAANCARECGEDPAPDIELSRSLYCQMVDSVPWHDRAPLLMSRSRDGDTYLEHLALELAEHAGSGLSQRPVLRVHELLRAAYYSRELARSASAPVNSPGMAPPLPDAQTAWLCFLSFPRWTAAVVVTESGAAVLPIAQGAEMLRQHVADWHGLARVAYRTGNRSKAGELEESSLAISHVLGVEAIVALLPPAVRRLQIHADEAIRNLPAAAWVSAGAWLVERFAIAHDTEFTGSTRDLRGQTILGVPVVSAPANHDAPGRVAEISWLSEVPWIRLGGLPVRVLDASCLTAARLAGEIAGAAYLHFVGHGKFDPYRPEDSGLVLVSKPDSEETLGLSGIENLQCRALQHATITACWGADAYSLPGRITDGIADAFLRAGAQSVLACMWLADPDTADRLTRAFTANLGTMPRDEALRAAQSAMIRDRVPLVHWAGWKLLGDPSPLRLGGATTTR